MSVLQRLRIPALIVVVAAAVALMTVPVAATYLNRVDYDLIEFRTASCGVPVASLLGAGPKLDRGSESSFGKETSASACQASSGKRVAGGLAILLVASAAWALSRGNRTEQGW